MSIEDVATVSGKAAAGFLSRAGANEYANRQAHYLKRDVRIATQNGHDSYVDTFMSAFDECMNDYESTAQTTQIHRTATRSR